MLNGKLGISKAFCDSISTSSFFKLRLNIAIGLFKLFEMKAIAVVCCLLCRPPFVFCSKVLNPLVPWAESCPNYNFISPNRQIQASQIRGWDNPLCWQPHCLLIFFLQELLPSSGARFRMTSSSWNLSSALISAYILAMCLHMPSRPIHQRPLNVICHPVSTAFRLLSMLD